MLMFMYPPLEGVGQGFKQPYTSTPLSVTVFRHPELVSGSYEMLKQVQHDFDKLKNVY